MPEAWRPDAESAASTNIGRFMVAHHLGDLHQLWQRSVDDPDWFWPAVVDFLGIPFTTRWESVRDESAGAPWTTWFNGGQLNLVGATVDRWVQSRPDRTALVWEGEDGAVRRLTWRELAEQVQGFADLLTSRGVRAGDAVGIYLPMVPETVAAVLGVAKVGAAFLPLFSGYAAPALVTRLADARAKAMVTADGFFRRGQVIPMLATALEAARSVPSIDTVVVVDRLGDRPIPDEGAVVPWPAPSSHPEPAGSVDAEHPLFIAYTSGTTGRPKGSVHVHGGWTVKVAEEAAFQFDCGPDDTLFWFTDMGWIMGPWEVTGALANGATLALYEGAPDHPDPGRLWAFLARHRVTICGISPTLVRALQPYGDAPVRQADLSALRVLGSTGEPWNQAPWEWYFRVVGGGRCPVINISGGTEIGACFLSPHPVQPLKAMSLGGPCLGMAVDVFDEEGRPVRGEVGELVCTRPWPSMTRGLYRDRERYLETYWSRWPGVWVHGDWASIDEDGEWFLHGRSDDTIKVAGKRLGPAEVESVIVGHPAVVEAAAIGVPDEVKGEALWVYAVLAADQAATEELRGELAGFVASALGRSFRPSRVQFVTALPKTRNAKVLRRAVRAVATGGELGDLSSLEDPSSLEAIRAAR